MQIKEWFSFNTIFQLKHTWVIHQGSLLSEGNKVQSCNHFNYIFLTGESRIKSPAGGFHMITHNFSYFL